MATEPDLTKLDELVVIIDDARTEIVQAAKAITEAVNRPPDPALMGTLNTILRTLDTPQDTKGQLLLEDLLHTLSQQRPRRRLPGYIWPASMVLMGLLGLGTGWQTASHSQSSLGLTSEQRCAPLPVTLPVERKGAKK